jgi:nitrate/nitrite transport system ATP-binding protein
MRQRVGLARAFAVQPKVLLLDEPFAQIDALTRGVIQEELVRMWTIMRYTVNMVTHDVDEALLLSDRIALMTNGPEARLVETVKVDIPRPRSRETMIDTTEYTRLRNHILHFLLRGSHAFAAQELSPAGEDRLASGYAARSGVGTDRQARRQRRIVFDLDAIDQEGSR